MVDVLLSSAFIIFTSAQNTIRRGFKAKLFISSIVLWRAILLWHTSSLAHETQTRYKHLIPKLPKSPNCMFLHWLKIQHRLGQGFLWFASNILFSTSFPYPFVNIPSFLLNKWIHIGTAKMYLLTLSLLKWLLCFYSDFQFLCSKETLKLQHNQHTPPSLRNH